MRCAAASRRRRATRHFALRKRHPRFALAPDAPLTARAARTSLTTTQGAQISLGALLMTVVGGGSPGIAASNPGLGKWLNGAIGLPVVRARLQGAAAARR